MKRIVLTILVVLIGWTAFGQFTLTQTITDPKATTLSQDRFGLQVDMQGDLAVFGNHHDDSLGVDAGIAYIYTQTGNIWSKAATLLPSDPAASMQFGHTVVISGDVIAISAPLSGDGRVYLYEKPTGGWSGVLTESVKFFPKSGEETGYFGRDIDLKEDRLLVGHTFGVSNRGRVYLYTNKGTNWASLDYDTLSATIGSGAVLFGTEVLLTEDGNQILTAWGNDDIRVYNVPSPATGTAIASQLIQGPSSSNGTYANQMEYQDSTLVIYADRGTPNTHVIDIWELENSGSFVSKSTLDSHVHYNSISLSNDGQIILGINASTGELECFKRNGTSWTGSYTNAPSKSITMPSLASASSSDGFYYNVAAEPVGNGQDYVVLAGIPLADVGGVAEAGEVKVYDLDISPQLIGSFPENGATGIKFQSDTTLHLIFDCNVQPDASANFQYLTSNSVYGSILLENNATVEGRLIKVPLDSALWNQDFMTLTWVVGGGNVTDAYGLTYTLPNTGNNFQLGNVAPPTITPSYSNAENQFARGTFTVDLQADDEIDTVAGHTIEVANAIIGDITRVNTRKFQFDVTPDFNIGDPDQLNQLTVKIPNTFFVDSADNVALDSVIIEVDYSQSIVRKDGAWLDGVPGNTYEPVLTDNVFIAENYVENASNLMMNNLIIGHATKFSLGGEVELDVKGDFLCEGSIYVADSASLFLRKNYDSGDSIFVKSGASLYTYEGFNHTGKIHAERKNSFGLGKYSFVGTPFEETESNSTAAFGSYVYAYDPTQPYGTDGLAQWVDASAETIIPGRGYTSSSSDTTKLSGTPNCGEVKVTELKYDPNASNNTANLGWQLLSNPYLAPLRVDEMWAANEEALEVEAIYLWDDGGSDQGRRTNSDYLVYNSLGTVGGANGKSFNGMLMPFQAFMVKLRDSIGGGRAAPRIDRIFTFDEDMRAATGGIAGNFFRKTEPAKVKVRVTNTDGLWSETIIGFTEDATLEFDAKYDAYFRSNKEVAIFSLLDDLKLAIQGLPNTSLTEMTEVPIGLQSSGDLSISIVESNGMESIDLYLKDIHTGVLTSLDASSKTIQVSGDLAKSYSLIFKPHVLLNVDNHEMNSLSAWGDNSSVSVLAPELSGWHEVAIYDLTGRVARQEKARFKNGQCTINGLKLASRNVYVLQIGDQSIKFILN